MVKAVGFDQRVFLRHLNFTALQTKDNERKEMYAILDSYLRNDIAGAKSRKNAITMLMKIWYLVDEDIKDIRDDILKEFESFNQQEKLLSNWFMTMMAYPFFRDVVYEFGRLFQLQEEVATKTIVERMKGMYGDRRRVEVATSAVVSSFKAWGITVPGKNRKHKRNEAVFINNPLLDIFLIKSLFKITDSETLYINNIYDHPVLFPFDIELDLLELREDDSFSFFYQGTNDLVVEQKHTY